MKKSNNVYTEVLLAIYHIEDSGKKVTVKRLVNITGFRESSCKKALNHYKSLKGKPHNVVSIFKDSYRHIPN